MRAEHVKAWLKLAQQEENPDTHHWDTLVELVQHVWQTGEMPTCLTWSTVVMLPKASGGFRGIGLLEVIWKLIALIIDSRLKEGIVFHDSLHGFCRESKDE